MSKTILSGFTITAIDTANSLAKTLKEFRIYAEKDIEVDHSWLFLALRNEVLEGTLGDYLWTPERTVPTRELEGTHCVIIAINKDKRLKYRMVKGRPKIGRAHV